MLVEWETLFAAAGTILGALVVTTVIVVAVRLAAALIARTIPEVRSLGKRIRRAWITLMAVLAVWIGCAISVLSEQPWWSALNHALLVVTVIVGSWWLAAIVSFGFERLMAREDQTLSGVDARRKRTQLVVLQRLALVVIAIFALGGVLFSFPELRALGTSLLASAGIASIIAGLAAQSLLGNLIAGIQVAFTDAVRVGDVVVVEGEWGRIGEINLSYVVVYIWDERRLVVPCNYFVSRPIETWTRHSDQILGVVLLDLDWQVPMDAIRAKFAEVIDSTPLWDRRSSSALVTGSQGGYVTVRLVMSAKNSADQWDLRCYVREQMIAWLQQEYPQALPQTRVTVSR